MNKLFDISCPSWEKDISSDRLKDKKEREEDLSFLVDQRGPRMQVLGKFSAHYSLAFSSKEEREMASEKREEREKEVQSEMNILDMKRKEDSLKEIEDNDENDNFEMKERRKRKSKTVSLEVPRKIFQAPGVCQMLDRTKQSNRAAVGNIAMLIKASNGNLNDFDMSTTTALRARNNKRVEEQKKFYSEFKAPKHVVVGWDGKIVRDVLGASGNIEYLAIVLSGAPDCVEGKMIEVEEIEDGSGKSQCDVTLRVVQACGAEENVRGLVFDTTASNSGVKKGAALLLMQKMEKVLMWFECRHHMAELIIKSVWTCLFGEEKSSEWADFKLWQKTAPFVKKEDLVTLETHSGLEEDLKVKSVSFLTQVLTKPNEKQQLPTDSYKQMIELTLQFLAHHLQVSSLESLVPSTRQDL